MSPPCVNVTGNLRALSHHKHSPEKRGPCIWAVTNLRNRPQNSEQQNISSGALSVETLHDSRGTVVNWQTILHKSKTYTYFIKDKWSLSDDNRSYYRTGLYLTGKPTPTAALSGYVCLKPCCWCTCICLQTVVWADVTNQQCSEQSNCWSRLQLLYTVRA